MPDIDNLSIRIESSVEKALPSFNSLITTLNSLNATLTQSGTSFGLFSANVRNAGAAVRELNNSLNAIKTDTLYAKLSALQRIDLSNLNKSFDFNIKLDGSEVQKTEEAFRVSSDNIKRIVKEASNSLINDYHIASAEGKKAVQTFMEYAAGLRGNEGITGREPDIILKNAMFTQQEVDAFKNGIESVQSEWDRFLNYFNTHKIKYIQDVQEVANAMEYAGRNGGMTRYFSKTGTVDVEQEEEMVRLANDFSSILSSSEMKAASLGDRVTMIVDALRQAKSMSIRSNPWMSGDDAFDTAIYEDFGAKLDSLSARVKQTVEQTKSELKSNKIMIDVGINEEKFLSDIQRAVNKAATIEYEPVTIRLKTDTASIKASITDQFKGIDLTNVTGLAEALKNLNFAVTNSTALKGANFSEITRELRKFNNIDSANFNATATALRDFLNTLNTANIDATGFATGFRDIASAISTFGKKSIETALQNIPRLGPAINQMLTAIANAPTVSQSNVESLIAVSQIALANRGSGGGSGSASTVAQTNSLSNAVLKLGQAVRSVYGHVMSFFKTIGGGIANGIRGSVTQLKTFVDSINPFAKRVKTATLSISGLVNAFWRLYTRIFMARRIISLFTTAINKSTNYIESYHYFDVATKKIGEQSKEAFSEMGYDSAEEYARSFRDRALELNEKMSGYRFDENGYATSTGNKSLGLDSDQLLQYQAQYAQMADSIGMSGEAALATSKALTMLAGDWSSLRNIDFSTAYEKMSSALAGQARAVRSLGIDITQASLAQTAANIGIETSVQKMNQSEKAMLRMITMIQQSKVAWGDLANTLNTPANQMRMLRQNLQALARTFGNLFLPIVAKVIPYINGLVIALQRLFQWLARLLGINPGKLVTSLGGVDDSLGDLGDLAEDDPIGGLADDADDAGDALDDANEAAKELRRTILSFDELNVLNSPDTSSSVGTSGDGGKDKDDDVTGLSPEELGLLDQSLLDALDEYEKAWNKAFENMQSKALEFAKRLEGIGKAIKWFVEQGRWREMGQYLADLANKGLKKLFDAVNWEKIQSKIIPAIHGLAEAFNGFIGRLDWGAIGSWIAGAINTLFGSLYEWYKTFDWAQLGARLRDGFTSMIEGIDWSYIGGYLGAKFMSAWRLLGGFVSRFPAVETGKALAQLLNSVIAEINELEITNALVNVVNNAVTALGSFLEDFDPNNDLAKKLGNGFNNFFANVDWKEAGKTLSGVINKAFDELNTFILEFDWGAFTIALGEGINSFIDGLDVENAASTLNSFFTNVLNSIKESDVDWKELGRKVADFIGGIDWLDHLLTVKDIIKEALGGFFSGLLSEALGGFGENFADGFVEGVDAVISFGAGTVKAIAKAFEVLAKVIGELTPSSVHLFGELCGVLATTTIAVGLGGRVASFATGLVGPNAATTAANATAVTGYATAIGGLTKKIGALLSTAGIGTAAATGAGMGFIATLAADIQSLGEKMSGYNGTISAIGTTMQDTLVNMRSAGTITTDQHNELLKIIDDCENAGLSMDETSQKLVEKMSEYGISTGQFEQLVVSSANHSEEAVNSLSSAAENLGDGFTTMASGIDVSNTNASDSVQKMSEVMRDAFMELAFNGSEFSGNWETIWSDFETNIAGASTNGQEALDNFVTGLKENWGASDEAITEFTDTVKTKLPGAVEATVGVFETLGDKARTAQSEIDPLNTILDSMASETSWSDSLKLALIVGALGTLAENGQDADGKLSGLSERLSTVSQNTSFRDMVGEISTALETAGTDSGEFYDALTLAIQNTEGAVPDSIANIKTSLEGSGEELSSSAKTAFANVGTGAQAGIDESIPYIEESAGNMADAIPAVFEETLEMHSPSKVMERSALNVGEGTAGGIDKSIPKIKEASKKMGNAIPTTIKEAFNAEKGSMLTSLGEMANAIVEKFSNIKQDISVKFDGLGYSISSAIGDLSPVGRDASMAVANGIGSALYEIQNRANEIPGIISSSLSGLYQMGESLGREFAIGLNNGIASQHISIPHIVYAGDSIHTYEGGTIAYPNFNVQWYAKGGLFTKPTLAGFGEAGAEAALPLSNKSVMAQIAKAITESGGYGGFSPEDMTEAVATGVAMAMSQNPQTVEVIVNSILKTNDEALAQSVERGRARLDMRYNATPSYNY